MSDQLVLTPTLDGRVQQVSYSSLNTHRACPQSWLYRYGYRLEQDVEASSPYATIGSWWSVLRAAEAIERGRQHDSLVPGLMPGELAFTEGETTLSFQTETVTVQRVISAAGSWFDRQSAEYREEFADTLGQPLVERLSAMLELWSNENRERFEKEHPLGVEVFVERELPNTATEGTPATKMIGFIDEVYLDADRNMVVIRDHKALKNLGNATSAFDDLMDSQLQLYAWLAAPRFKELGLATPRAVAYDRTRSQAPKSPVLTASGGLSKSVTDYDRMTYLRWAETDTATEQIEAYVAEHGEKLGAAVCQQMLDMPAGQLWGKLGEFYVSGAKAGQSKFGVYEYDPKVSEALSSPEERAKWHSRTLRPVQKNVIAAHLRAAVDTALDLRQTAERAKRSGDTSRNLTRRGCQFCDFAKICRAQLVGGTSGEYDLPSLGLRLRPEK